MGLVERAEFLDTLARYGAEAADGAGRLVLLAGEAGVGKTALLEAFRGQTVGARWLWGSSDGLSTPQPLTPLFDLARQAGGELAERDWEGASRQAIFAASLRALDAPSGLTVAVVEDAHWADEATFDWLRFVSRRMSDLRLLLVVTYRDEGVPAADALRQVVGDLATQRVARRMTLPCLTIEGIHDLAEGSPVDVEALYALTAGNPFYATETLAGQPGVVPPTVLDAVLARVARLPASARRTLEVAAVIGPRIEPRLLEAVVNGAVEGSETGIDDCLATGSLLAFEDGWAFRHELTRRAVEGSIPAARRAKLHARVLAELQTEGGRATLANLAYHAEMAGDGPATVRYATEAGRHAASLRSHHQAVEQYRRALRFVDGLAPAERAALYDDLAEELATIDHWEESAAAREAALDLWRELGETVRLGDGLGRYGVTLWRLCRGAESERTTLEAVSVLETAAPGPELARAYARVGAFLADSSRPAEGVAYSERALELGRLFGAPETVSYALDTIGCVRERQGEDGIPELERSLQLARDDCEDAAVAFAYTNLYQAVVDSLRATSYEWCYEEAMRFCEDHEQRTFSLCLRGSRGAALVRMGRSSEAATLCRAALDEVASPINRLSMSIPLATIEARCGDPAVGSRLDDLWRLAVATEEIDWQTLVAAVRLEAAWLGGQVDDVAADIHDVHERGRGQANVWYVGPLLVWMQRTGLAGHDPRPMPEPYASQLAGDHHRAAVRWHQLGSPYEEAMALMDAGGEDDLRASLALLDPLGATAPAAVVRRRLRLLGARAIPRGAQPATRGAPFGLTSREQEVLVLVADGLANGDISERLFISERTVEHHVSAVLAKMGVDSRMAAAREAARVGLGTP